MTPPTPHRPAGPSTAGPSAAGPAHEQLRAEVAALRRRERRRIFPARLCVGPASDHWVAHELAWPPRDAPDDGLLFDVLDGLHDAMPGPAGRRSWLVRPGAPEVHDLDLRAAAVAERVAAARGTPAPEGLVVLTRYGWLDPRSGESRTWKRLRVPSEATGP